MAKIVFDEQEIVSAKITDLDPVESLEGSQTIVVAPNGESKRAYLSDVAKIPQIQKDVEANARDITTKANGAEVLKIVPQTLSEAQKQQARSNIGATGASDLGKYLPLTGGTLTGGLNTRDIYPSTNNTAASGGPSLRWASVHSTAFYEGGTLLSDKYVPKSDVVAVAETPEDSKIPKYTNPGYLYANYFIPKNAVDNTTAVTEIAYRTGANTGLRFASAARFRTQVTDLYYLGVNAAAGGDLSGTYPNPRVKRAMSASTSNSTDNGFLVKTKIPSSITYRQAHVRIEGFTTSSAVLSELRFEAATTTSTGNVNVIHLGRKLGAITVFRYDGYIYLYVDNIQTYTSLSFSGACTGYGYDIIDTVTIITTGVPEEATAVKQATVVARNVDGTPRLVTSTGASNGIIIKTSCAVGTAARGMLKIEGYSGTASGVINSEIQFYAPTSGLSSEVSLKVRHLGLALPDITYYTYDGYIYFHIGAGLATNASLKITGFINGSVVEIAESTSEGAIPGEAANIRVLGTIPGDFVPTYSLALNNDAKITYYLLGSAASSTSLGRTALNGELAVVRGGNNSGAINYTFQINATAAYTTLLGNVVGFNANLAKNYHPQIVTLTYDGKPYIALCLSAHSSTSGIWFRGSYDKNGDNEVFQKVASDAVSNVVDITTRNIIGETIDSILCSPQNLTEAQKQQARSNIGATGDFSIQQVTVNSSGVAAISSLADKTVYTFSGRVKTLNITGKSSGWDNVTGMAILCFTWDNPGPLTISYGSTGITSFDATAPQVNKYSELTIFNNKAKLNVGS